MRFVSWNVNGLRAVLKKGFEEIVAQFNADVFALQETKLQAGQAAPDLPGYHEFWSYAERKGYSGTAVFTKEMPLQVLHGLGFPHLDDEGRIVACEFPEYWFVCVYTPNAQNELARIDHRMEWDDAFRDFCKGLEAGVLPEGVPVERADEAGNIVLATSADACVGGAAIAAVAGAGAAEASVAAAVAGEAGVAGAAAGAAAEAEAATLPGFEVEPASADAPEAVRMGAGHVPANLLPKTTAGETAQPKPVVMCGDFNVAHNEIDLKNPKTNRGNAGFSDEERGKFDLLLDAGFADTFRDLHPDLEGAYSWWSYRFNARKNNTGWRIDYFLVSENLSPRVRAASIYDEVYGSDHCPVGLELED